MVCEELPTSYLTVSGKCKVMCALHQCCILISSWKIGCVSFLACLCAKHRCQHPDLHAADACWTPEIQTGRLRHLEPFVPAQSPHTAGVRRTTSLFALFARARSSKLLRICNKQAFATIQQQESCILECSHLIYMSCSGYPDTYKPTLRVGWTRMIPTMTATRKRTWLSMTSTANLNSMSLPTSAR